MILKNKIYFFLIFLLVIMGSCARPVANFSIEEKEYQAPVAIQFENKSENAESYEWNFGDGNTSTEEAPKHRYRTSGDYTIVLKAKKGRKTRKTEQSISIQPPQGCLVEIETNYGTMLARLSDLTPLHRDNFSKLAEEGFYDGLLFHRVIENFMIQGGDPDSKNAKPGTPLGGGNPGYMVDAEFHPDLVHVKGALAAARTGDQVNPEKKSSGSQFYIVHGKPVTDAALDRIEASKDFRYTPEQREAYLEYGGSPFLDQNYTVFGQVIDGLEVLDKIATVKKDRRDRPVEDVKMKVRLIH